MNGLEDVEGSKEFVEGDKQESCFDFKRDSRSHSRSRSSSVETCILKKSITHTDICKSEEMNEEENSFEREVVTEKEQEREAEVEEEDKIQVVEDIKEEKCTYSQLKQSNYGFSLRKSFSNGIRFGF